MDTYPSLLRPNTTEEFVVNGQAVNIPKVELALRPWAGPPILNSLGGKPLVDFGGRPFFAELCVYELARLSGWDARWVETYGAPALRPNCFISWANAPLNEQKHEPIVDPIVTELLQRMAAANGNTYAGCWDVVAWDEEQVLFMELKRRKQDRVRATQLSWLETGLRIGLRVEQFLIVEWKSKV
jgi:hypothetical protein